MQNIIITGGSSGIGAALARAYAGPDVHICIIGRNAGRLGSVAQDVETRGGRCTTAQVDITDRDETSAFLQAHDKDHPIDILFINAGIFDGRKEGQPLEDLDTSLRVIDTNLVGVLHTLHAALPAMRKRGRGHIVFTASLASMVPLGGSLGYSASKSAVMAYGLGLKQVLRPMGINVSVVCPGFIHTPLAERYLGWQPFKLTTEKTARIIKRGVRKGKPLIAFPLPLHLIARPAIFAPDWVRRIVEWTFSCHAVSDAGTPARMRASAEEPQRAATRPAIVPGE